MVFVLVPGGSFLRRSAGSGRQAVHVDGFLCQDAPVTVGAYRKYLAAAGRRPDGRVEIWDGRWMEGPTFDEANSFGVDRAVVGVSYDDASEFVDWLNRDYGGGFRLPTEAEFEYAAGFGCSCRTTGACIKSESTRPDVPVPVFRSGRPRTCPWPVRAGIPDERGLWDLHGLVWQWCSDWYADYPVVSAVSNPRGPEVVPRYTVWNGKFHAPGRAIRGGSYAYPPSFSHCGHRHFSLPSDRNVNLGFRVVRDLWASTEQQGAPSATAIAFAELEADPEQ